MLRALAGARQLLVLTGAGMSAESGLPTFRGAQTGLWSHLDPMQLATEQAFRRDPALVWGWYEGRRMQVQRAAPNAGHRALADLQQAALSAPPQAGMHFLLVTQNVDDLHERAGSRDVIHLHGQIRQTRCIDCGRSHPIGEDVAGTRLDESRIEPPRCPQCDGFIRPGVVWFGESLPLQALARAEVAARSCDAMLVVGTSGRVHPAAGLADLAIARGIQPVVIDPAASIPWRRAVHLRGTAATALPAIAAALRQG